ncbi:MAG: amidohydrolase [Alphaproteobacteria bacterium]|nr:amidohydrolase [Rhodospirillaceae bacterium]MBT7648896.1 amidohydrolase [Rhodospirillaceae bacterium]MDG2479949.1 amidohydrolase [Alphaproteobacteria bacterium]
MTDSMIVLRGGLILDAADRNAGHGDILIDGGVIREVGPLGMAVPEGTPMRDVSGHIVIPGLVNAHTHGHGSFGKGRGDLWSLELLLNAGPWISAKRSHEDKYLATLLNAADMTRRGCTAVYDLTWEQPRPSVEGMHQVAAAYDTIGMRALISPMMADLSFFDIVPGLADSLPDDLRKTVDAWRLDPYQASIDACREVLATWPFDTDKLRFGIAPTIPMHCTDEFLTACAELSDEFQCPVQTHMAESKLQSLVGQERYGKTLTAHFDDLGLLTERFTSGHGVWLDGDDMRRMADRGASVAHNPASNMRLGSGLAAVREMREAGVNVGLGSDGSNSSDNQNMFEATRLAAYVSRVLTHDLRRWVSSSEALEMATLGGARSMGFERLIGRIAPGYKADLAFLDLHDLAYVPLNDPFNQLVYADDGASVVHVMIDGDFVYEDRTFKTIDIERVIADVEVAMERLNRDTADRKEIVAALEPHVADHCICFSSRPYHVARICEQHS